jgi:hypothetical protein
MFMTAEQLDAKLSGCKSALWFYMASKEAFWNTPTRDHQPPQEERSVWLLQGNALALAA